MSQGRKTSSTVAKTIDDIRAFPWLTDDPVVRPWPPDTAKDCRWPPLDEADGRGLIARVEDFEDADACAIVDSRELVETLPATGNPLEKLHVDLQSMPGLRLFVALPAQPSRPMFLIGREPAQAMLAEEAVDGRAGDRHLMEPSEIIGDPAGTEVILLAQIQDLADDLRRGRARASLRRAWAINSPVSPWLLKRRSHL